MTFFSQNFDFCACPSHNVLKRDTGEKKGKLLCCKRIFDRIKGNLAEIQPKKSPKFSKNALFAKSSRSQLVKAGVVTSIAIQTAKYGKNMTGDYHDDDSSEDSDEEDACSSEDKVLAAGPWSEEEEEFIIIPETVTTRSGRVTGSAPTVSLH